MRVKNTATTVERVNQLLNTEEPTYPGLPTELSSNDIAIALNWYSQNQDKDQSHKYLAEYCKSKKIKVSQRQLDMQVPTLGFVCRMLSRGAILDTKSQDWLDTRLKNMALVREKLFNERQATHAPATLAKPVAIQDRLKEKFSKCIGALEGLVDEFILSDFKTQPNFLLVLRAHEINVQHGPSIVNFFKKNRDEFKVAHDGTDAQVSEAYSNYTVPQLRKMEKLYDGIMSDTLSAMGESKVPKKKTRKTK
jgi:hypothetical protein